MELVWGILIQWGTKGQFENYGAMADQCLGNTGLKHLKSHQYTP